MTTETIQIRRGINAQRTSVVFAQGEPVWTTDTQAFYIGDGVTPGGIFVASGITGAGSGSSYNFSGLGTVTVTTSGNFVYISGANNSVNLSGYITTGNADLRYYPLTGNPSGFLTGFNSGIYVTTGQTGNFITTGQTGIFATTGYVTGASGFLQSEINTTNTNLATTGQILLAAIPNTGNLTGQFYPLNSNPSGYLTGQTGNFYPANNPSGFVTGISPSVYFGAYTGLVITGAGTYSDGLSGYGYRTNFFSVTTGTGQTYTGIINMQSGFPGAVLNYYFIMQSGNNMNISFQTSGGVSILVQSGLGYQLQVLTTFIYNGTGWINTYWA